MELPKEVKSVIKRLKYKGYEAYAVGGCVRELLRGRRPKDWDVCTNAKPEAIQKIFPHSFYSNEFGTVTVKTGSKDKTLGEIEITTYRIDEKYTDKRHPDRVRFTTNLRKDLARRDFTINAIAFDGKIIVDPFNGRGDIEKKIVRAVGNPEDRFNEDALRMMRAVRIAATLGFEIEPQTFKAIQKNSGWIQAIAKERIRDELIKIVKSDNAYEGMLLLKDAKLLRYIIPELEKGVGITQNRHHIYTIFEHSLLSLKYAVKVGYNLRVRLAALFHDIAKPQTKRGKGPDATFYNHDQVGAKFASQILGRLRFPRKTIEKVATLVRNHMFFYNVDEVSEAGIRRLLRRVGPENMEELIQLRIADRVGSGCPKPKPYKLRHLEYLIEKVSKDPISVKMLKVDGEDVMKILKIKPGPRVGLVLNALLAEVLEDPQKNKQKYLEKRIKALGKLSDERLKTLTKKVKEKKEEVEIAERAKHRV